MRSFNSAREAVLRQAQRAAVVGSALLVPFMAHADVTLPTGAATLFTDTATLFGLVLAAAYVLMLAITGGWITFDIVKRGAKKASK